ncbi:MAG: hypothetical protein ACNY01_05710 [Desulfobacteria bacterium]
MKKTGLLLFMVSLVFTVACATREIAPPAANGTCGFRGIAWDTPLDQLISELESVDTDAQRGLESYTKKDDTLTLGKATVDSINYVFYQKLFSKVSIVVRGTENYEALKDYLFATYGGNASKSGEHAYTWSLDNTVIMFAYTPSTKVSLLIIQKNQR